MKWTCRRSWQHRGRPRGRSGGRGVRAWAVSASAACSSCSCSAGPPASISVAARRRLDIHRPPSAQRPARRPLPHDSPAEESTVDLVDAVMDDAQDMWQQRARRPLSGDDAPLFRDAHRVGCGFAQSATGPFYCPADPSRLSRSRLLQTSCRALRRAGRFRAGLRARPRARPSRPDAARHRSQVRRAPAGATPTSRTPCR